MIRTRYSTAYAGTLNLYHPDAYTYINAVTAGGGSLTSLQQGAIDTLIKDFKAAGIWYKSKAIYLFIGGTATTHKWNLKDPRDLDAAFRLTFFGGWTHNSSGVTPNGTTGYASTFFTPRMFGNGSSHISFYSLTDDPGDDKVEIGMRDPGVAEFGIQLKDGNVDCYSMSGTTDNYGAYNNTNSTGFYTANRIDGINQEGWKNGILKVTTANGFNYSNTPIIIGAQNDLSLGGAIRFSGKTCAFASLGEGLTAAENLAEYNAVQKFQTTLSRNI